MTRINRPLYVSLFAALAIMGIVLAGVRLGEAADGAVDKTATKTGAGDAGKPRREPPNDGNEKPKASGKEQYRIRVIQGEEKGSRVHWVWVDQVVTLGTPFDVRAKNDGAATKGVLERTKDGGLHFKGDVRMGYHVGAVDTPVELGKAVVPKKQPDTPLSVSGFVRFERPQPEGAEKAVKVLKRASDLSEKVGGGKVFGQLFGGELLVVPGPRPAKQTLSQWFQDRLKAENALTADQETWLLYRSMQFSDYDRMSIERIEQQGNTFTVITNRALYTGPLWRNVTYHEVHGINLGKLPAGEYTVELIIRQSTFGPHQGLTPDPAWGELKENFTIRAPGVPEGKSTQTNKSDGAKPSVELPEGSKQKAKSSGMKERFRFEFWKRGAFRQGLVIQDSVAVNEPFDIRAKNGATASGVLRRTAEGSLHFKGEVSHSGMSAVFDTPVELGKGGLLADKTKGGPDSDGFQWISVYFSLSHVEENVPAGLGLGVSGKRDQVIVVPGPKAEKQRPSGWFDSRLKAENVLTADQETWVLFRSKQLNPSRMWIERIERDENTFTVTMNNGPETTAGDDHYEVHGVNLGKLPTGTNEVKWIIHSGKGGSPPQDNKPAEPVELKSSFKVLEH